MKTSQIWEAPVKVLRSGLTGDSGRSLRLRKLIRPKGSLPARQGKFDDLQHSFFLPGEAPSMAYRRIRDQKTDPAPKARAFVEELWLRYRRFPLTA